MSPTERKRELARLRQQRRRERQRVTPVTHPVTHHPVTPVTPVTQEPTITMTKARYDDLVEEVEVLKLRVAALETQAVTQDVTHHPVTHHPVTQEPVTQDVTQDVLIPLKVRYLAKKIHRLSVNPDENEAVTAGSPGPAGWPGPEARSDHGPANSPAWIGPGAPTVALEGDWRSGPEARHDHRTTESRTVKLNTTIRPLGRGRFEARLGNAVLCRSSTPFLSAGLAGRRLPAPRTADDAA